VNPRLKRPFDFELEIDQMTQKNFITRFFADESGATAIEYGLIAALISVAIITAATTMGTKLSSTFSSVSNQLK
jgi:pilus assembly protein Flp/PilA